VYTVPPDRIIAGASIATLRAVRTHVVLGTLCLLWSGAFAAIKVLVDSGMSGRDVTVVREAIVLPVFVLLLWRAGRPRDAGRHGVLLIVIGGFLGVGLYTLAVALSEEHTASGTTSLLVASSPAFSLVLALLAGQETATAGRVGGIASALTGVAVVIYGTGQSLGADDLAGPAFALLAALAWAGSAVVMKPALRPGNVVAATAVANVAGILALAPLVRPSAFSGLVDFGPKEWFALVYLSFGCTLLGYLLFTEGLRLVPASVANTYLLAVPPLSVVIGAVALGESITAWIVAGAALIVTGIALAR
jgi:drug/metabolite transporter (DMT)-like permease